MENVCFMPMEVKVVATVVVAIVMVLLFRAKLVAERCRIVCLSLAIGLLLYFFYTAIRVATMQDYSQHPILCGILGILGIVSILQICFSRKRCETRVEAILLTVMILLTNGTLSLISISWCESFSTMLYEFAILAGALFFALLSVYYEDEAFKERGTNS